MSGEERKIVSKDNLVQVLQFLESEIRIDQDVLYESAESTYKINTDVSVEIEDYYNCIVSVDGLMSAKIGEPYSCIILIDEEIINSYYYAFIDVYIGEEKVIAYQEGQWTEPNNWLFNIDIPIVYGEIRIVIDKDKWD